MQCSENKLLNSMKMCKLFIKLNNTPTLQLFKFIRRKVLFQLFCLIILYTKKYNIMSIKSTMIEINLHFHFSNLKILSFSHWNIIRFSCSLIVRNLNLICREILRSNWCWLVVFLILFIIIIIIIFYILSSLVFFFFLQIVDAFNRAILYSNKTIF